MNLIFTNFIFTKITKLLTALSAAASGREWPARLSAAAWRECLSVRRRGGSHLCVCILRRRGGSHWCVCRRRQRDCRQCPRSIRESPSRLLVAASRRESPAHLWVTCVYSAASAGVSHRRPSVEFVVVCGGFAGAEIKGDGGDTGGRRYRRGWRRGLETGSNRSGFASPWCWCFCSESGRIGGWVFGENFANIKFTCVFACFSCCCNCRCLFFSNHWAVVHFSYESFWKYCYRNLK